jgi:hypothetical protein
VYKLASPGLAVSLRLVKGSAFNRVLSSSSIDQRASRVKEASMDTPLELQHRRWHPTDWVAAAVAGFAAGAVLMVLDLIWSSIFAVDGPWRTSHMIAPIFVGADSLTQGDYHFSLGVVTIALATHYALGILFGLVLATAMAQLRRDARARAGGRRGVRHRALPVQLPRPRALVPVAGRAARRRYAGCACAVRHRRGLAVLETQENTFGRVGRSTPWPSQSS